MLPRQALTVVENTSAAEPAPSRGGDAASLGLIQVRRSARTANVANKAGDLTHRLRGPVVTQRSPSPIVSTANGAPHAVPARPAPVPEAPPSPGPAQSDVNLLTYWNSLRGGRDLPSLASLDRDRVAAGCPNTLLVSYGDGTKTMPQIARLGRFTGEIEYTSMVTEWILSCARQAADAGKRMEKEQNFPVEHRSKKYGMLLLPLTSSGKAADHVLCRLICLD